MYFCSYDTSAFGLYPNYKTGGVAGIKAPSKKSDKIAKKDWNYIIMCTEVYMQAEALKNEATTLVEKMDVAQLLYVIQFMKFIQQSNNQKEKLNNKDFALINASYDSINAGAEENLDFQADIWG